jgi:ankyrin repeat protein
MDLTPVPFRASLAEYQKQAEELLGAWRSGDSAAIQIVRHKHPRFLDSKIPWLPKKVPEAELRSATLDLADAQLTVARWYDFADWPRLSEYVEAVTLDGSSVATFESAVEAVTAGDGPTLALLLRDHPELVRSRSTRVTHFDPPVHRATLLHYVAANGVEHYRQHTPNNAVDVATMVLQGGAEVDALADMYGGQHTTMSMLVSSCHPAEAGVQVALVDTLVDFGAAVEARGSGAWTSPLLTALAFGYLGAAEALVRRGARVDDLAAAAGLGRLAASRQLLTTAMREDRHRALVLSAQHGHAEIVGLLLDAGEDPNRYNPKGNHGHSTPLHQAVVAGHDQVVRLLVERGARLDIKDTIYDGTPLDWAIYAGRTDLAAYLRAQAARDGRNPSAPLG